jgi:hypothetical protein
MSVSGRLGYFGSDDGWIFLRVPAVLLVSHSWYVSQIVSLLASVSVSVTLTDRTEDCRPPSADPRAFVKVPELKTELKTALP